MTEVFRKLRERKLVQWTLAYLALAWLLTQVFALLGEQFDWGRDTQRLITLGLGLGTLPALVVAWYHGDRGAQRVTAAELVSLAASLALAAGIGWAVVRNYQAATPPPRSTVAIGEYDKLRVAVLPLENLGGLTANAGFAGGFHDTLIAQVARVPKLTVISRTSVLQWEGKRPSVAEVARALEVGTVLEGSVQRDGDRVRVNVQLIDAATDAHLWAEVYDRTIADAFAVQSEIAAAVAVQLELTLTRAQRLVLDTPPTTNPRAYEQLMLARAQVSTQNAKEAVRALEAAVALDPASPVLFAELATAYHVCCFDEDGVAGTDARRAASKAALDRALALDASRPEVQLALATDLYYREQDTARAIEIALPALAALPNDVAGRVIVGFLLRRVGRWQEAQALFQRAVELDPRNGGALDGMLECALALRNRDDLARAVQLLATRDPDGRFARLEFGGGGPISALEGDIRGRTAALEALPPAIRESRWAVAERIRTALRVGDFAATRDLLSSHPPATPDPSGEYEVQLGLALRGLGDEAGARRQFELALARARKEAAAVAPGNRIGHATSLSVIGHRLALLGQESAALQNLKRAVELVPFEDDAADGLEILQWLASGQAMLGRDDEAIASLERMFARTAGVAPGNVWLAPEFAALRANPKFRALMAREGVNVSLDPHDARPPAPTGAQ